MRVILRCSPCLADAHTTTSPNSTQCQRYVETINGRCRAPWSPLLAEPTPEQGSTAQMPSLDKAEFGRLDYALYTRCLLLSAPVRLRGLSIAPLWMVV